MANAVLERLLPTFERMFVSVGRFLGPPAWLLKASLLVALYSVRSERFCEEIVLPLVPRYEPLECSFNAMVC